MWPTARPVRLVELWGLGMGMSRWSVIEEVTVARTVINTAAGTEGGWDEFEQVRMRGRDKAKGERC